MKKTLFIKNALILTASSLVLRFAGIIFKVWLAAEIGSEGIGLYQLIFSVYVLASTFATTGISTAVTRLVAEELAVGSRSGTFKILRRAIEITLLIAAVSIAILFFFSSFIGTTLLGDARSIPALKILPLSLPFMGVSSCIRGYFIARRKVTPNAVTQILEQAVRIGLIFFLITRFINKGLAACCAAVIAGDVIAEAFSGIILFVILLADRKNLSFLSGRKRPDYGIVRKILHISLPITSGRYLNTLLRTAENLLVPKNLARFRSGGEKALSQFGMIKGMALPILFFPSAILNAVSTLMIPEMSEAAARNQNLVVKNATQNILRLTAVISYIFGAIFFVAGERIGLLIYREPQVGFLLRALSPIVPLMYLDSISDGILKGLDQQLFSFRTAISDSVIRIILILLLLPISGLNGFIAIMYFSNFLTCFLNVGRLIKLTGAALKPLNEIFLPIISALAISLLTDFLLKFLPFINNLVYIMLFCVISTISYFAVMLFSGVIRVNNL